jgi:hypothetical protein
MRQANFTKETHFSIVSHIARFSSHDPASGYPQLSTLCAAKNALWAGGFSRELPYRAELSTERRTYPQYSVHNLTFLTFERRNLPLEKKKSR